MLNKHKNNWGQLLAFSRQRRWYHVRQASPRSCKSWYRYTQTSYGSCSRHSLPMRRAVLEIALSLRNAAGTSCQQTSRRGDSSPSSVRTGRDLLYYSSCRASGAYRNSNFVPLAQTLFLKNNPQSFKSINEAILCILITFLTSK